MGCFSRSRKSSVYQGIRLSPSQHRRERERESRAKVVVFLVPTASEKIKPCFSTSSPRLVTVLFSDRSQSQPWWKNNFAINPRTCGLCTFVKQKKAEGRLQAQLRVYLTTALLNNRIAGPNCGLLTRTSCNLCEAYQNVCLCIFLSFPFFFILPVLHGFVCPQGHHHIP